MRLQKMNRKKLASMTLEEIIDSGTHTHAIYDLRVPVTEKNIIEFNKQTNKLKYGYFDITTKNLVDDKINKIDWEKDEEKYVTMTADEVKKYRGGVCYDFVTYQNKYINKFLIHPKYKCFFHEIAAYEMINSPNANYKRITHTFMLLYGKDYVYWIESAWENMKGVYRFKNEIDALLYVKESLDESFIEEYKLSTDRYCIESYTSPREYDPAEPNLIHIPYNGFIWNLGLKISAISGPYRKQEKPKVDIIYREE